MSILALTSDTLIGTPAAGNVEYNGQFFGTDSNNARAQMQRITQGTSVASTSGTSIDFTALPSWIKRITVMFAGVSTSGTSQIQVQLGSGSPTTTGYIGGAGYFTGGPATGATSATTGFIIRASPGAADIHYGLMTICLTGSNTWIESWTGYMSNNTTCESGAGAIALAGVLDRVRLTTVNGTDTFDAGSINIMYEG